MDHDIGIAPVVTPRVLYFLAIAILCLTQTALAQSGPAEVFIGYSLDRQNRGDLLRGWNTSVTANVTDYFGIVADLSRHRVSSELGIPGILPLNGHTTVLSSRFGPRVTWHRVSAITPFAQVLIGPARLDVGSGFQLGSTTLNSPGRIIGSSMAAGFGLDLNIRDTVSVRILQMEYNVWRFEGVSSNGMRASFGLVFKVGGSAF